MPNEIELNVSGGESEEILLQVESAGGQQITMTPGEGGGQDGPFVRQAEAWARGTRNGVNVPSTDPTYQNNSKHYAEQAQQYAGASAGFVVNTGAISSLPKVIQDERISADCVVENDYVFSDMDIGWVTAAGELRLYGSLRTGETKPSVQLWLRRISGLTADPYGMTLELITSSSEGGNYLVARARNLLPGKQYTFRLYKVVSGGTDVQVYGCGTVTGYPTYAMWFQEVARGLEDGESYYVTLDCIDNYGVVIATSNTVEFVGGANVPVETEEEEENEEPEETPAGEPEEEPEET